MFSRIISSAQLSQRLVKLLAEVLGHHGREDAAREVVRQALAEVCGTFDADDPIQLELFANGELADAVAEVVGPDYVDEVVAFVIRTAARPTSGSPPPRRDADTVPDAKRVSSPDEATQPLALVITEDDALYDEAMRVLDRAGILCFECGGDPLEVVSESRALDAAYLVYDADVSSDHPAHLCAQVRRALGDETPRAVVLIDDDLAHLDVDRAGWLASIRKRRLAADLVDTLRRVEKEPREGRSPSLPQGENRRRRTAGRRTGAGAAAMARRGRRTFDHVLGEALGSVANDRILEVVLENALDSAGMKNIPTSAARFEDFVAGPLRESVSDLLGDDAFAAVRRALQPVIKQAVSINYQRRRTGTHAEPEGAAFGRILLVHRDERTVKRLSSILSRHGDEILTATDGYVALGMLMQHPPQLVIADAELPAVSGEELIAQCRKMHGVEAPPVIVIGEYADGATKNVSAPVKPSELLAAVVELQRGQA